MLVSYLLKFLTILIIISLYHSFQNVSHSQSPIVVTLLANFNFVPAYTVQTKFGKFDQFVDCCCFAINISFFPLAVGCLSSQGLEAESSRYGNSRNRIAVFISDVYPVYLDLDIVHECCNHCLPKLPFQFLFL